jgi:iron complex outermembrane receptor protein
MRSKPACRYATCFMSLWFVFAALLTAAPANAVDNNKIQFHIPSQSLQSALNTFALQAKKDVLFSPEIAAAKRSAALDGEYDTRTALQLLLAGTGLTFRTPDDRTILVDAASSTTTGLTASDSATRLAQANTANAQSPSEAQNASVPESKTKNEEKKDELAQIVVTGTHIRGIEPAGSAITVYTRKDIQASGAGTLEQFARLMPENFSDIDTVANYSSSATFAQANESVYNAFQGAGFDLHGLGPSATLTLLNGHRLAPAGAAGSFADISQIPLSAIDHIDVMADGASAIYGADAVAGVVNIVTRKDFTGLETSLRYGGSTHGGGDQLTGSQLIGQSWGTGNFMLDYEFARQNDLDAAQRGYNQGGTDFLIPANRRNSVLFTGSQSIDDDTIVSLDAGYSSRDFHNATTLASSIENISSASSGSDKQYNVVLAIQRSLISDWRIQFSGDYSRVQQSLAGPNNITAGAFEELVLSQYNVNSNTSGVDVLMDGSIVSLPAGRVKMALGASFREEGFDSQSYTVTTIGATATNGSTIVPSERRHVKSAYGELLVPIVAESNSVPLARRLELSAAGRYDDYSDFGSTVNPKVGLLWEPFRGLDFRATYGTSFRAPLLYQLGSPEQSFVEQFPDSASPSGSTDTLELSGGNPRLLPETSRSFTAGFDVKPQSVSQLLLKFSYFHVTFDERILIPPLTASTFNLTNSQLAPFVVRNPPLAEVQAYFNNPTLQNYTGLGPASVQAIYDRRLANIASTKEAGFDLAAQYGIPVSFGQINLSLAADRLLEDRFQAVATAPPLSLLNGFGEPPKWKGRAGVAWLQASFSASFFVNYVGKYANTLFSAAPPVGSWTTGDLRFAYDTGDGSRSFPLRDLKFSLSIQNIFDRRPPYVAIAPIDLLPGQVPITYDPVNASPLGRFIAVEISKAWGR